MIIFSYYLVILPLHEIINDWKLLETWLVVIAAAGALVLNKYNRHGIVWPSIFLAQHLNILCPSFYSLAVNDQNAFLYRTVIQGTPWALTPG